MSSFSKVLKPVLGFDIGEFHIALLASIILLMGSLLYFIPADGEVIIKGVSIQNDSFFYWLWLSIFFALFIVTSLELLFRLAHKLFKGSNK
jgi:hypothetical protein